MWNIKAFHIQKRPPSGGLSLISELGRFREAIRLTRKSSGVRRAFVRAVIRLTRKSSGVRRAFETGAAVSKETAKSLVNTVNSL